MNELQNLVIAVLLVMMVEIANEIIIALFSVKNAETRFRIRLISLLSCFFVFLVLPLKMVELIIPSGESLITSGANSPYFFKGPVMLVSCLSRFAWISIGLFITAISCLAVMVLLGNRIVSSRLDCQPASDAHLLTIVEEVSNELGVKVNHVMISEKRYDAFVYGYPPSLAIGNDLLEVLDEEELRIIIRHELYHVKGRDTLLKPLFTAFCIIFLYNPMVWFLYKKLVGDRECYADRGAITCSRDTRTFLSLLLKVHDLGCGNLLSPTIHWTRATGRIDSLFSNEKARKVPVLVCLFLTFSSLFVGGTHLFEDRYLEIGSSDLSIDSVTNYSFHSSNPADYFVDTPLQEWYQKKNDPRRVRIPLQESELVELLKKSEYSEGSITIRLATLPIGRRRQLFGGNDFDFGADCHLVIDATGGELFVSLDKIQQSDSSPSYSVCVQYSYSPMHHFTRI